jgi:hypothetical protein
MAVTAISPTIIRRFEARRLATAEIDLAQPAVGGVPDFNADRAWKRAAGAPGGNAPIFFSIKE